MGTVSNLVPWKPGQSGNPKGSSRKARQRRRLRDAMGAILESEVPESFMAAAAPRLPPDVLESIPPDLTWSELIALRVALIATLSAENGEVIAAAKFATDAQDGVAEPLETKGAPVLELDEEQREAFAAALGISADDVD